MNYILAMNNPMKFIIATTILLNMICLASIKTKNILGMEPDIRTAFISENISENFPDIILNLLRYDENEYIRQLAKKSLENS